MINECVQGGIADTLTGDDWQSHPLREVVSPSFRAYSIDNQLIIDTKVVEGWRKL